MKYLIKTIFLFTVLGITFISCEKELSQQQELGQLADLNQQQDLSKMTDLKRSSELAFSYDGLEHNGKWFIFNSSKVENIVWEDLLSKMNTYDDPEEEQEGEESSEEFNDPSPVLSIFEQSYRHQSLRVNVEKELFTMLERGSDPVRALNRVHDHGLSEINQAFANERGIKQVGSDLFYYAKNKVHYKVANNDLETFEILIHKGYGAALSYSGNVEVISNLAPIIEESCSAEFSISNGTNLSVTAVYQGNGQVNIGVTYTYHWGDGTTTASTTGTETHTYATAGNYDVTLVISVSNPSCQDSYTVFGHHVSPDTDWIEEMCDAAQVVATVLISLPDPFSGPLAVFQVTPGSPTGTVIFSLNPASSLNGTIISYLANGGSLNDIVWDVDGVISTGLTASAFMACPRDVTVALSIPICDPSVTLAAIYSENSSDCLINTDSGWIGKSISSTTKASMKLETGINKAIAEVRHYKKKNNGNWKLSKANLHIQSFNSVARDQTPSQGGCPCSAAETVVINKTGNKKKMTECYHYSTNYDTGISTDPVSLPIGYTNWSCDLRVAGSFIINVESDRKY